MMSRLAAWWHEFWPSVVWAGSLPDILKKMGALAVVLLPLLGFTVSAEKWPEQLRPWVPYLVAPAILYATWKAAVAWEKSKGPIVEVGPLSLEYRGDDLRLPIVDSQNQTILAGLFFVRVTNGPVPARVCFLIVSVTDSRSDTQTERSWQGHWRSRLPDFDGTLAAGEQAQYGFIGVARFPSGNPALFIYSSDSWDKKTPTKHSMIPISLNVPLEEQGIITFDVVLTCETLKGERGVPKLLTFGIAPDPESPEGYRVATEASSRRRAHRRRRI
jgi:hypothetical protein